MIEVVQLRKSYNGTRGLDGFNLCVEPGELFGLVGPNGAGKTTLIKTLATLLPLDSGQARVGGLDVASRPQEVKRIIGYIPDQPGLYQDMRVREFLEFFAGAFYLRGAPKHAAVEEALERSGLSARSQAFVEELSFGMKQRLFLAKTLLHHPKLLLLDEPATGLDPLARIELRQQLKELNATGVTVLISSHILSDLEDICTRVALIAEGKNAADASGQNVIELQKTVPKVRAYAVEILSDVTTATQSAEGFPGARILEVGPARLVIEIGTEPAQASQLLRHLVTAGVEVVRFDQHTSTLEDRYRQAFGGKVS